VYPFNATATTSNSGILEGVADALSIDSLKKREKVQSLNHFFTQAYGGEFTQAHRAAQRNFAESMAGTYTYTYSGISYLLNIKDRHNGNLMLSRDGRLIHIDFGFMFATSPGGISFESAPFKLSQELVDVMGGVNDPIFPYSRGLRSVRQECETMFH
jgi:phosphatidylinositol kinase/protein kinase (PI-3  family)